MKRRIIESLLVRVAAESERLGRCTGEMCGEMMKVAKCGAEAESRATEVGGDGNGDRERAGVCIRRAMPSAESHGACV